MKRITLNIPESEYEFFMDLLQRFNYKTIVEEDVIPREIQEFVIHRQQTAGSSNYITQSQLENRLKDKYGI
jgi:hypothetical protein